MLLKDIASLKLNTSCRINNNTAGNVDLPTVGLQNGYGLDNGHNQPYNFNTRWEIPSANPPDKTTQVIPQLFSRTPVTFANVGGFHVGFRKPTLFSLERTDG